MWLPVAAVTDTTGLDVTQLGVSGVVVVILLIIVRTLWTDLQKTRSQLADLNAKVINDVVPAVTKAADVVERALRRERGDG